MGEYRLQIAGADYEPRFDDELTARNMALDLATKYGQTMVYRASDNMLIAAYCRDGQYYESATLNLG